MIWQDKISQIVGPGIDAASKNKSTVYFINVVNRFKYFFHIQVSFSASCFVLIELYLFSLRLLY